MALRCYGIGKSPSGTQYNAAVYDTDWSSSDSAFQIAKDGIKIEWRGESDEDIHSPMMGSIATIEMLVGTSETTVLTFLSDLRTSKEGRFFLEIETQAGAKIWRGIITADALGDETDQGPIFGYTLTAVCGLALLKKIPYYDNGALYYGRQRLTTHAVTALGKLSHVSTFWAADDAFLETSVDWWEASMTSGDANDPLYLSYVDHSAFYDFKTKGGPDKDVLSCYDVLKNICLAFGCRIRMRDAKYVIEQIDYRVNSTYNWRTYKKNGDQKTYGAYSGVLTVDQTQANAAKLTYVTYDFLSQYNKTQLTYEAKMRRNYWQNILVNGTSTFNFNQTISSNSGAATMRMRGTFFVTIRNDSYTGNATDVIIPQINITLKIGAKYLKRTVSVSNFSFYYDTASWTNTNTDVFVLMASGQTVPASGQTANYIQGFDFITPALVADGALNSIAVSSIELRAADGSGIDESQFTISWSAAGLWLELYDLGTPDVQEDEVLYESENLDGGTDTWERNGRLGSGSINYSGSLINSDGTTALTQWGQGAGSRNLAIGALMAKRVLDARLRVKKRLNGQLYGNACNQVRKLISTSDSLYWLDMRVLWHVTENILEGSWVNLTFGNSSTKTPVKVKILTGGTNNPTVINPTSTSPTTGGNSPMVANPPGAILNPLSFNALATQITKGATVTSIAVGAALAGNEFAAGDKVKLVNPITGQVQTFTVASAPSAGATSISVNSATANFDIPVNAGMFVQLTPQAGGGGVADGDKGDITVSSAGTVWTIDNNVISNAKIRQSAAYSVVGRAGNTTGDVADITAASEGQVLRRTIGGGLEFALLNSDNIVNFGVSNSKIGPRSALSVMGRSANTTGVVADITAGTDGHVLRRSGTTLGFGQIVADGIADGTITLIKMANITGPTILGRSASGAGAVAELNTSQLYSIMNISNAASNRLLRFNSATSIVGVTDLTYNNGTLKAESFSSPTDTSWTSSYITFGNGAGAGATVDSFSGSGNWALFTFTTGTSPNSGSLVAQITFFISRFNSIVAPVIGAANANAAAQMNNFYITSSNQSEFTLYSATNLPASTQFSLRFLFIGN